MKDKKILFFDIDGTLLTEDTHIVASSTIEAINQAKNNGHLVFINTGRPFATIDKIIRDLNPDGYICGCGVFIKYHDEILLDNSLSNERCLEIVSNIKKYHIEGVLESSKGVYFTKNLRDQELIDILGHYKELGFNLLDIDDPLVSFDKFGIWFDDLSDQEAFKETIPDFECIIRTKNFWEIVPKGYSKATGIQFIVDYFNNNLDNCYVFGDSFNDESMLSYVKHAVVMGNGDPELFKHAFYVTDDIHNDGIAKALKHLGII